MTHYAHIASVARTIARKDGRTDIAARYLYNRGISFRTAYYILFGVNPMA
jgi:hypothetical protein